MATCVTISTTVFNWFVRILIAQLNSSVMICTMILSGLQIWRHGCRNYVKSSSAHFIPRKSEYHIAGFLSLMFLPIYLTCYQLLFACILHMYPRISIMHTRISSSTHLICQNHASQGWMKSEVYALRSSRLQHWPGSWRNCFMNTTKQWPFSTCTMMYCQCSIRAYWYSSNPAPRYTGFMMKSPV